AGGGLRGAAGRVGGLGRHLHHDRGPRGGDGAGVEYRRGAPRRGGRRRSRGRGRQGGRRREEGREPARGLHRVDRARARAQRRVGGEGGARVGRGDGRGGAPAQGDRLRGE